MPLNLELKIKLNNFNNVLERLRIISAGFIEELHQKDVYYSNPSALLKLRLVNGKSELIIYSRNESARERVSAYEVLEISSSNAEKFLNRIYEIENVVEKKRLLYMFDNTRIHLDEVKNLGFYLEIETLVLNGMEDAKTRFDNIIKLLQLDISQQIKASYKDLLQEVKTNDTD